MDEKEKYGPNNRHPLSRIKTELIWEGKYDEFGNRREVDVVGCVLPLQKIEAIDEPFSSAQGAGQLALFKKQSKRQDDFRNMLIWGDNKLVMASLLGEFKGKIDLIYIDPPFDVGADFTMNVPLGDEKETVEKDQSALEMVAYRDTWGKGKDSYLYMMYERLALIQSLLSENGSLYVHCDWHVGHYIKLVIDEIFGVEYFRNEVVWKRSSIATNVKTQWRNSHDILLFYGKSPSTKFNVQYGEYSESSKKHFTQQDEKGIFQPVPLLGSGRTKGESGQPWKGIDPNKLGKNGMHWLKKPSVLDDLDSKGLIYWPSKEGGVPRLKYYVDESKGPYVTDFWDDIYVINAMATESLGYSTQKPEALVERIMKSATDEGGLVADFFCGSGTTGAVAEKLGRRWIMCDLGRFAIHTTRKRMIELQRGFYEQNKSYRAFDVYNLGRYERQWWQRDRLKGMEEEHRKIVLAFYQAESLTGASSPLLHGRKGAALVHVDGIDSILTLSELRPIVEVAAAANAKEIHCLAWEFEMELKRNVEALEHEFGVKVRLIRIPREVMEKNRRPGVDHVPFFEMATLAAEPVVKIEGGVRVVDVRLTSFLPSLSEVPSKELEALKERAIKSGFDFIDFWAVDFDHQDGLPFKHHWQDYRLRKDRSLKLESDCGHRYEDTAAHKLCVKVIDTFGCDTSIILEVPGARGQK